MTPIVRLLVISVFLVALLPSESAFAKESIYNPGRYITAKRVKEVYDAVQEIVGPDRSLISMADAREIVTVGTFSAMAQSCGLPWEEQIFLPMMARYRHGRRLGEHYMTIVGLMHGFQQGTVLKALKPDACDPEIRELLIKNLRLQVPR